MTITIRVPATSANLGVGFDTLGLALQKYGYFTFVKNDKLVIEGCPAAYANEKNLVYQAYQLTCHELGQPVDPIHLMIETEIPMSRGLGSSASCVVAGVAAAFYLNDLPFDSVKALDIATKIEGHPDNVAPAILGGFVASTVIDGGILTADYPIHPCYHFLVLIPNFATETQAARTVLPKEFPFETAVRNNGKLALLFHTLAHEEPERLRKLLSDELHEPFRKKLIDEYAAVREICMASDSAGFYISGSGSTLMNVMTRPEKFVEIQQKLKKLAHHWQAELVPIDHEGVKRC